jgi:hypothetical protein
LAANEAMRMPSGFPITNPKKIPHAMRDCEAPLIDSDVMTTPVLANAKTGTTKKVLMGWNLCSSQSICGEGYLES